MKKACESRGDQRRGSRDASEVREGAAGIVKACPRHGKISRGRRGLARSGKDQQRSGKGGGGLGEGRGRWRWRQDRT